MNSVAHARPAVKIVANISMIITSTAAIGTLSLSFFIIIEVHFTNFPKTRAATLTIFSLTTCG